MSSALFKKNLCAVLVFFGSISLWSQNIITKEASDSSVIIEERLFRNDRNGEAVIIQRKRNDSLAEEWIQKYISEVKKRLTNQLRQTNVSGCSNLDFEDGNFSNWTCQTGVNNGYPAGSWTGTLPVANRHTIVSGGTDPYGGFPCVAPGGGTYSVKLGNNINGAQAEQLIYSFIVQPQDTNFIYKYAVVFENPNHALADQPYFELKILDNNGNVIPCSYQHYVAQSNIPGFSNVGNVWYKPWTTQGVNLTQYVGQVITVIVTSADCSHGGHFGYGYIDFICPSSFTTNPDFQVYCENVTSTTLYVPNIDPGMQYQWSTGQTTPSITINPQLYDNQSISVYIYPPNSYQCGFWYIFNIKVLHSPQVSLTPANPILCYGQTTTTISTQVSGGNPPYTYLWNNGANTPSITVGQGNYQVFVYDASGCPPVSASTVITANPAPITAYAGPDQTLCITETSVNLNGTVSMATGGIWTGGSGIYTPSNSSLSITYYPTSTEIQNGSVTLILTTTGNGSCPAAIDSVTVYFKPFMGVTTINATPINCYGNNNATATVSVTNGTPPFTYMWSTNPIQTTQSATNLSAGSYTVTITDSIGCSNTASVSIQQPTALTAYIDAHGVSCFGNNDGYATVTAFGGTPGYSYIWSNGNNSSTVVGLTAGNYSVTVTDALGCQYVANTVISTPLSLTATISNVNHVLCADGNSGSASVTVSGGTPNYSYSWSSGAGTSNTAIGLIAGTYTVTVTDQNNCSATAQVTIQQPSLLQVTTNVNHVTCFGGSNGSASLNVSGGTPPYQYVWTPYGGTNATASNLVAGFYNATITDNHGCQQVTTISINQPEPLIINATTQNVLCFNTSTGSAQILVSGGTPPYSYNWNPAVSSNYIATGLNAGNFSVTVSDVNNCSSTLNLFINQPSSPLNVTLNTQNISCYGIQNGNITANASGGTPPYQYLWMPGGSTSQTINNLATGNYFVTVTDANGCSQIQSASISQPGGINLNISTSQSNCGMNNGQASVSPSGGTPPYTYLWSPGNYTTATIAAITSGIYHVTVTDAMGCSSVGIASVNDVSGPQVNISNSQPPSCFGSHDGWISVTVTGGQAPYLYAWYPYGGNSDTAHFLGAGTYSVVVSDANGCQGATSINPPLTQPEAISIVSFPTNVSCFGASNGSVNINVSGGTPPYSYQWSPGNYTFPNLIGLSEGAYQVTVTDSHNCTETYFVNISQPNPLTATISNVQHVSCYGGHNGSITVNPQGGTPPYSYLWSPSGNTSQTASGLSAGTHTVYINDANGCSFSLSVQINQPPILNAFIGLQSPTCNNSDNGMAWVLASGGVPPYQYSWSPLGGTNDTAYNIHSGTYIVTVTDQNSCQVLSNVQITQPSPVTVSIINFGNVSCYNGSNGYAIVSVSGGIPPYTYVWSTGSTIPSITNLTEGTYYVTVSDAKGCTAIDSIYIQSPGQPLSLSITHQDVSCFSGDNGYAVAQVAGGTPPYHYIWVPTIQFTAQANNLLAGTYTVSVSDANGCQIMGSVTINQPLPLIVDASVVNEAQCFDTPTGSASVNVSGGIPPYSYLWNTIPNQTTQLAEQIYAGQYKVTVSDANGCTAIDSVFVSQPPALQSVIVSYNPVTCYGGNDGMALGGAMGGTPPYHFSWDTQPTSNSQQISNLQAGTYTLTITDNNNCTATSSINIQQSSQVVTIAISDEAICLGDSMTISATASGGTSPYVFNWMPSLGFGNSHMVTPTSTTQYIVIAFDSKGCQGLPDTVTVHVKSLFPENVNLIAQSPICPGNTSQITLQANCESWDTLNYSWDMGLGPGSGPFLVAPIQTTWYHVTATNTCGFYIIDSAQVAMAPPPVIQFTADTTQGCSPITINFTDSSYTTFDDIHHWTWHFGDGNTSTSQHTQHYYQQPGTYYAWLEVETSTGCLASSQNNPLPIYVFEHPVANFLTNKDVYYLPNDPVICTNLSSGAIGYQWDFGDGYQSFIENPKHDYNDFGRYEIMLVAINTHQCTDTAVKIVQISGDIQFPNAFTPDPTGSKGGHYSLSDYSNHIFFPVSQGVNEFKIQIFNRWGELVFESNDINIGWDGYYKGQICQQDVYVYQATATFVDGRKVEKKGDVLLIR